MAGREFWYYPSEKSIRLEEIRDALIKGSKLGEVIYIGERSWETEDTRGTIYSYWISPGFHFSINLKSLRQPFSAIGEEEKESEFKKNLEKLIGIKLNRVEI